MSEHQVIHIHHQAPAKPAYGMPCNGCGVCCLSEPCPVGAVLSVRLTGPCRVLHWDASANRYRCGAMGGAEVQGVFTRWRQRWVGRWIAAGAGCDCKLQAHRPDASADQGQDTAFHSSH